MRASDGGRAGEPIGHLDTMDWFSIARLPPDQVVLPGVTAGAWTAFLSRPATPEGAVFESGVRYGAGGAKGRDLKLFLYRRADRSERRPGVVFVHGGGWQEHHPYLHIRHANHLAAEGFVTATVAYRLHPEATWPSWIEDVKCSVRWLRANAATLGLDPDRIAVAGGSAGGQLAALVALTPGMFEGSGGHEHVSSEVQAAVLWSPITDLRAPHATGEFREAVHQVMETADSARLVAASPISYVHPGAPPVLTVTGDHDETAALRSIREFHDALDQAGVQNTLEVVPGVGHAFDLEPAHWHRSYDLMAQFLRRELALTEGRG